MCYAFTSNTSGGFSLNGALRSRSRPSRLLRSVLQDALSEVMKVYPTLEMKVFVDDFTAFMKGRNKELVGIAEKVFEGGGKGSGREGSEAVNLGRRRGVKEQSRCVMQLSRSGLQQKRRTRSSNQRGNTRSRLENENEAVGSESESEKEECDVRFSHGQGGTASFRRIYLRIGVFGSFLSMGLVPAREET